MIWSSASPTSPPGATSSSTGASNRPSCGALDLEIRFIEEPDWTEEEQPQWTEGDFQPQWIIEPQWIIAIDGFAWQIYGGTGFFTPDRSAVDLPAVVKIVRREDGQAVDLTGHVEFIEGRLRLDANAKAWVLNLEFDGDEVIAPMFHPLLRAGAISLEAGGTGVWAGIREGEARFF